MNISFMEELWIVLDKCGVEVEGELRVLLVFAFMYGSKTMIWKEKEVI